MEGPLCEFKDLPDEILLKILTCHVITVPDLGRIATSCSRLSDVVGTTCLWRLKLRQHWPKLWDQIPYDAGIRNWQEEVQHVVTLQEKVQDFVRGLSRHLYHYLHLTTRVYAEVDALVASSKHALIYVNAALRKIIDDGPQHPQEPSEVAVTEQEQSRNVQPRPNWRRVLPLGRSSRTVTRYENMTEKYYALKIMGHVHQNVCKQEWEAFISRPVNEQPLEVGAILVARWFQAHTDISSKQVSSQIDELAEDCRAKLSVNHSDHPALTKPLLSPYQILPESQWSQIRCHQIFKCINNVLFSQVKLSGNSGDYHNLKNSLINEVLKSKKGIPITLCIIYTAVCHRLGVLLEPVSYPCHFVMRWKIPGENHYEYIDAFYKGRRLTWAELIIELPMPTNPEPNSIDGCSAVMVFQRMVRNIMNVAQMQAHVSDHMELFCSATELMSLLSPADRSVQELLLRIYYTLEIHYDRIVAGCHRLLKEGTSDILQEMLTDCERILEGQNETPKPITVKKRCKEINYATGLVMKHKRYLYTCVIFGWDKTCRMPNDWVQRMGVYNLLYKTEQPFYNVLVYDGSHRYAAQENLEIASDPEPIIHTDVGKYFKTFTGKYYLPNSELQEEYPEDEATRGDLLRTQGWL